MSIAINQLVIWQCLLQKCEHRNDTRWWDIDRKLILPDAVLLDIFREAGQDVGPVFVHRLRSRSVLVGWILNGRVYRLHCFRIISPRSPIRKKQPSQFTYAVASQTSS